jgi:3'-phosphoadenosine 5'-phosphosulfate sulfotransferase (PAPS reductase)/FAD synthetase
MTHPFPLFEPIWSPSREVLVTPEITSVLEAGAAVAIGVSGGKDSAATALATIDYLEDLGHRGPRVLIHSDLGRVEWRQSLPACHRLADRLGLELIVVRRETGDLLDRWRSRWESNVRRYAELSCVKLILPWSTAAMRFCTSELKTSIICRALVQRFAGQTILSAIGIRRQESPNRAKAPVANHSRNWPAFLGAPRDWTGTPFSTGLNTTCSGTSKREILRLTRHTRFTGLHGFRVVSAS